MQWSCSVATCVLLILPIMAYGDSFRGIGDLPGGKVESAARDVSGDGRVVVGYGYTTDENTEAFRWTDETGMVGLGRGPRNSTGSRALGASTEGSTIAGYYFPGGASGGAFYWRDGRGFVGAGDNSFPPDARAYAVSDDGRVIVGETPHRIGNAAAWWGVTDLGATGAFPIVDGQVWGGVAYGVSRDGVVIVGEASSDTASFAFRWSAAGGVQRLSGEGTAGARDVSPDGSVVTGYMYDGQSSHVAFRWTASDGARSLGTLLIDGLYTGLGVSADGRVIVGAVLPNRSGAMPLALLWDDVRGLRLLQDDMETRGLDLSGWTLWEATGVSDDGRTIVGWGRNPAGHAEAWVATIPEPSVASVLVLLGCLLRRRLKLNHF